MSIRIGVVDDQELGRTGFAMILSSEPDFDVVFEAGDGREAIDAARRHRADVVLMDIRMPDVDGIQATRVVVEELDCRVLILTTFDLDDYVYAAIRAGASGFLLKDTPPDDLVRAVRLVAGGDALLSPSVTRQLISEFAAGSGDFTEVAGLDTLTERETEVLVLIARGLSNAEIAERLYLGETTVKTHVSRVLLKLDVRDRVQAVVAAYESGLVVPGTSD